MPTRDVTYTCIKHMKPHFCVFCGTNGKNPDMFFPHATLQIDIVANLSKIELDNSYLVDVPYGMLDEIRLL